MKIQIIISTVFLLSFSVLPSSKNTVFHHSSEAEIKAMRVLIAKCNICHRRQNPFKIFRPKNMNRHAPNIYKQVFELGRMPKGNKIKLLDSEKEILKTWLEESLPKKQ